MSAFLSRHALRCTVVALGAAFLVTIALTVVLNAQRASFVAARPAMVLFDLSRAAAGLRALDTALDMPAGSIAGTTVRGDLFAGRSSIAWLTQQSAALAPLARDLGHRLAVIDKVLALGAVPESPAGRRTLKAAIDRTLTSLGVTVQAMQAVLRPAPVGALERFMPAAAALSGLALIALLLVELRRRGRRLCEAVGSCATTRQAHRGLAAIVDAIPSPIAAVRHDGRLLFANIAYSELHGLGESDRRGCDLNTHKTWQDAVLARHLASAPVAGSEKFIEQEVMVGDLQRTFHSTLLTVAGSDGEPDLVFKVSMDVSARRSAEARVRHLADHDLLTNLPNRRLFHVRLEQGVARAAQDQRNIALLMLDLDSFKDINDSLGHSAGDDVLNILAERFAGVLGANDFIARLGGDEFAIIQYDADMLSGTTRLAGRLLELAQTPVGVGPGGVRLSASIGIAFFPEDAQDARTLVAHADRALQSARTMGRNRYSFFLPEMYDDARRRRDLEQALAQTIATGGETLSLAFQPRFRLPGRELASFEVLARWTLPDGEVIPPAEFVGIAEESGLIVPLGRWVIDRTCRQLREWHDAGHGQARIAINVSPVQIENDDIVSVIEHALERHGLRPGLIELEITEQELLAADERVHAVLRQLRRLGVRLALDDFGTGYSSLGYLQQYRFDCIKIDRSFVASLARCGDTRQIVGAMISLAHMLSMEVVAEGIETDEQLRWLNEMKCDEAQGFLLATPQPVESATRLLEELARERKNRPLLALASPTAS